MSAIDTPIQQRLEILQEKYTVFSASDAFIYRWMLEADEISMFESYFELETSVGKNSSDLFLQFKVPFQSAGKYDKALYGELSQNLKDYLDSDEKGKVDVHWVPDRNHDITTFKEFLFCTALTQFWQGVPDLEDRIIVYLDPQTVSDYNDFQNWILSQLESSLLENIRFMVVDYTDAPRFDMLQSTSPKKVSTHRADLDMTGAMKEINAASGDSGDPDVQFRAAYMDMSKAITKKDMDKSQFFADRAIEICVQEGWTHLQIGVLVALGTGWIKVQKSDFALKEYDKAEQLARSAINQDDAVAGELLPTVLFAKASVFIQRKDYNNAVTIYESIPPLAERDPNRKMEGWRMTGFCYEQMRETKLAMEAYNEALSTAEQLEMSQEDARRSTVPYIGRSLLRLSSQKSFQGRLDRLMGQGWQRTKIKIG